MLGVVFPPGNAPPARGVEATRADRTPHERRNNNHQYSCHAHTQQPTMMRPVQMNHHHHHHHHHDPRQQHPHHHALTQTAPSNNGHEMNLLPPHIHSMLYHSIVGDRGEFPLPPPQQQQRVVVTSVHNSPSSPATGLHTVNYSNRQFPPHRALCEVSASRRSNMTGSTSTIPAMVPYHGTAAATNMITPSPYSENASVGDGSASPWTTRGYQSTDIKRQLYTSPLVFSSTVSPSRTNGDSSIDTTNRTLERELKAAENDELIQLLLELSSCNQEAARFIQSKARLFSLRRTALTPGDSHSGNMDNGATTGFTALATTIITTNPAPPAMLTPVTNMNTTTASLSPTRSAMDSVPIPSSILRANNANNHNNKTIAAGTMMETVMTSQRSEQNASFGIVDRFSASTHVTPSKPLKFEEEMPSNTSYAKSHSAGNVSSTSLSSCNPNSVHVLLTPYNQRLAARLPVEKMSTSPCVASVGSESRPWSSERHPCLRWYGSCRHPTSCPFFSSPQNLCLNWIRGSCMSGSRCSGVHRLPDVCPLEVLTVFELCNGGDREVVVGEKLRHRQQVQTQEKEQQQQQENDYDHSDIFQSLFLCTEPNSQAYDGSITPIEQMIFDPASVPASLEHYHHELKYSDEEVASLNQEGSQYNCACRCRSCRSPSEEFCSILDDNGEHDEREHKKHENEVAWKQLLQHLPPPPPPAQPLPRCLNDSFAAAAAADAAPVDDGVHECSEENIALNVRGEPCCEKSVSPSTCRVAAAASEAEMEEDGVEFPPDNTQTRSQSPAS